MPALKARRIAPTMSDCKERSAPVSAVFRFGQSPICARMIVANGVSGVYSRARLATESGPRLLHRP
jgi:hypothetical protein